jgi:putative glycosyltransferase (TIGR04372 family)
MQEQSVDYTINAAVAAYQKGDFSEAMELFESALLSEPLRSDIRLVLIQAYQQSGQHEHSIRHGLELMRLDSKALPVEVKFQLISVVSSRGDISQACSLLFQISLENDKDSEILIRVVDAFKSLGRIDYALHESRNFLHRNPACAHVSNNAHVGKSLPARLGRLEIALRSFSEDLKSEEGCTHYVYSKELEEFFRATYLARAGLIVEAIPRLAKIQEVIPEAILNHALCLMFWAEQGARHELYLAAAQCLAQYQSVMPADIQAAYHLARCVHADSSLSKAFGEASVLYDKVLALCPHHTKALFAQGDIAQRAGDIPKSSIYYQKYYDAIEERINSHPLGKLGVRFLDETSTYAMGHLAYLPETYRKEQIIGWRPEHKAILLAPQWYTANKALLNHWKDHYLIVDDDKMIKHLRPLADILTVDVAFSRLPSRKVVHARIALPFVQKEYEEKKLAPLLTIDPEIKKKGWEILNKIGISPGSKFITLHVREDNFKGEQGCLHNAHRNANIEDYFEAIDLLIEKGYQVIRLGEPSSKAVAPKQGVFDYAHSPYKSDWMDIFLCAEADIFLGASGGVFATPQVFGTPLVATNFPPTYLDHSSQDLFIPKLMRDRASKRLLTFKEIFSPPIFQCEEGYLFAKLGIEFVDNTPGEIKEIVQELLERFESKLVYTEDDQVLQNKLRSYTAARGGLSISRMGRDFLRRHQDLL